MILLLGVHPQLIFQFVNATVAGLVEHLAL